MRSLFLLLLLSAAMSGCERGQVLARVGGESITNRDLEDLAEINPRLKPRLESPEGKRKILDSYIEQSLLYREANRRGLQRSEQTRKRLALYKKIIIAQAALDDELNKKVQEFYDSHRDEFETVKISHILIRACKRSAKAA